MSFQFSKILDAKYIKKFNGTTGLITLKSRKCKYFTIRPLVAACVALLAAAPTLSVAALALAQYPPVSGGNEPAPNVIISVDDSGSMNWDVNGNSTNTTNNKRITLLKNSLKSVFGNPTANPPTNGVVPDNRIRLAWQVMHNNGDASGASSLTPGNTNSMKAFSGTHRTNFNTFINSLSASGDTPSHKMAKQALDYMKSPAGTNSPWADMPGTAQTTQYLSCRRSYHIFMTDGGWNSDPREFVGNADGTARTLGDGTTSYDPASAQVRIYKDAYGGGKDIWVDSGWRDPGHWERQDYPSTLADFAFESWASDLQNGSNSTQNMVNNVRPLIKKNGVETVGGVGLQEFWNPKNDPATWQHMVTHTIGFGNEATSWSRNNTDFEPYWNNPTNSTNSTYGGGYPRLVSGDVTWRDPIDNCDTDCRPFELWHMALNGRGKFYPAVNADSLTAAFNDILSTVIADTSRPLVSIAANSSSLRSGLNAYLAGYASENWLGTLTARPIDSTTGTIGASATWDAAALLDDANYSVSSRFVLSYNGTAGIAWTTWNDFPTAQKTPLDKNSSGTVDSKGQNRVDYLRGDRTKEASQTNGVFRNRSSRLGDIVNSNIWYTGKPASGYSFSNYDTFRSTNTGGKGGRTPMIYVGANDGMLHGFAAGNWPNETSPTIVGGKELLAYIPQGVAQGDLRKLTDTGYSHQYFVDGSPFTGDAYLGTTPAWATVLVGSLGAGGKGYFVLNVTDPANFTTSNVANLVIKDTTATTDADIGNIMSPPVVDDAIAGKSRQIVRMNNGRWAAVLGNGYNSTNEAPVLLIQYLDGDKAIKKLSPCADTSATCSFKGNNGLASPQLIDLNGDGKLDIAYAGDLKGNVWKFNLSSATESDWSTAFSGQPFFVAKTVASVTPSIASVNQPITTAPFWMPHPSGGIMLAVSTGQNLTIADQTNTNTNSVYGLWDNSTFSYGTSGVTITDGTAINTTSSTGLPSTLVQQTISTTPIIDGGKNYYTSSTNAVIYPAKRGWYLNWSMAAGQRVLHNSRAFSGQKVLIQSTVPKSGGAASGETCSPTTSTERSFLSVFNMFTGKPSALPAFSLTSTTTSNTNITTIENTTSGDNLILRTDEVIKVVNTCPVGESCTSKDLNPDKYIGIRANWREIQ
ncbi:pilus assembly protein [Polaromonas naphthalenivorans]|nr:PilC/PilY family type IV pilus protein [Polaromonas naphthalenivorans]